MTFTIVEDDAAHLAEYERIPIGFTVSESFDADAVAALLRGEVALPTALATPYWKDYDSYEGNRPTDWSRQFDVTRWTILSALQDGVRVGGAIVVHQDPQVELVRDCRDCAVLWDIRVAADKRVAGIGSALLRAAATRALARSARAILVETQQVNVPACRFYMHHGFRLERAAPGAYPDLPNETQLIWQKTL